MTGWLIGGLLAGLVLVVIVIVGLELLEDLQAKRRRTRERRRR